VFGGYQDTRGDAARNSLSLLNVLQDDERLMELKHFCVGRYNTKPENKQKNILFPQPDSTAILKGIAVDLKVQRVFPACFEWGNLDDFKLQIADKQRLRDGKRPVDTEEAKKTAESTFKPKSLRNKTNYDYLLKEAKTDHESDGDTPKSKEMIELKEVLPGIVTKGRKKINTKEEDIYNTLIPGQAFKVKLRHTAINDKSDNTYKSKRRKTIET
jgi:hypothetical protein